MQCHVSNMGPIYHHIVGSRETGKKAAVLLQFIFAKMGPITGHTGWPQMKADTQMVADTFTLARAMCLRTQFKYTAKMLRNKSSFSDFK